MPEMSDGLIHGHQSVVGFFSLDKGGGWREGRCQLYGLRNFPYVRLRLFHVSAVLIPF